MYRCTGVQVYRCTGVQVYRCTGVQVYRCTGVQVRRECVLSGPRPDVELYDKCWLTDSWRKENWDFQKVLGHMHFTYWTNVFFNVWVAPDDKVSSKNVLQVSVIVECPPGQCHRIMSSR